jgi:hypothetical protein
MMKFRFLRLLAMLLVIAGCWIAIVKAQAQSTTLTAGSAQAALDACSDKDAGDVCSFTNEKGDSINGSCGYQGGVNGKLTCIPIH